MTQNSNNYLMDRIKNFILKNTKDSFTNEECELFDKYSDFLYENNKDKEFNIDIAKKELASVIKENDGKVIVNEIINSSKFLYGIRPTNTNLKKITSALANDYKYIITESALLSSIISPFAPLLQNKQEYSIMLGYMLDDLTAYFDATRPSRMELILNSDFEITNEQKERTKKCIKKIIENKISKYNNQPNLDKKGMWNNGRRKVLVIDQSYGDYSIVKGLANDNTFRIMLESAIKENPNADIIIKTHPDAMGEMSFRPKCYYKGIQTHDNIYKLTTGVNPISLIEMAEKIYVCSSQFGFEALMLGKEVHTFGMPFYAGWGLTIDAQKCERRIKLRTLEEIFYITYILLSVYIHPKTKDICEIENAIEILIKYREMYFDEITKGKKYYATNF